MKLKDIGEYYIGLTYKPEDVSNDGTIVLRSGNIQDGQLCLDDIIRVSKQISPRLIVQAGDILMCSRNGSAKLVGKSTVIPCTKENMTFGAFMTLFRTPYNNYLQYFFLSNAFRRQLATGKTTTINQITINMLNNIDIEIPDSSDLQKRCKKLNAIKDIITKLKQQLQDFDTLIKARFVELSKKWDEEFDKEPLSAFLDDITYGFTNPMPDANDGPWKITAKDVVDGHIDYSTARKTTQEAYDALTQKSKPRIGSVLLTKDGTLGRTAVVENERICVNQSVAVLNANDRILPRFLEILLRTPPYQNEMIKDSGGGTIKHIYITKVDKMLVTVPSIDMQSSFISLVSQVDKSKVIVQKALDETQLLFDGLMQQYFG